MRVLDCRPLNGPNIYSHSQVIKMMVDLEESAALNTRDLKCFVDRLLEKLPGLRSHYCSRGYAGGFVERLYEGTYLGHVLEHVILELLNMCGMKAGYGKTISGADPGQVELIFEYSSYRPAVYLSRIAVKLLRALLNDSDYSLKGINEKVENIRQRFEAGPSTAAIVKEAKKRGIPVTFLKEGTSLLMLGYGKLQKRIQATLTSETSCLAADIAGDKCLAKELLDRAGIPTPEGSVVLSPQQAVEVARRLNAPVVIKPCDANQGKGVSLNLFDPLEIEEAFQRASCYSSRIMVEQYITGRHYRILVVGGHMIAAARRLPAQVIGDGSSTIAELVQQINIDPNRGVGHARPLTKIKLNQEVKAVLARQGLDENHRPPLGKKVLLRENANLSSGGFAWDVTFKVHPDNAALAERAAAVIGLDVAGIDLVASDIGKPVYKGSGAVIEVNAAPGIRMHLHPSRGRSCNAAEPILARLFPEDSTGRIPIASITGTNGKTTTARMLAHIIGLQGKTVGLTTTEGVYIGDKCVCQGDTTGPCSARMILENPLVEAAVLETARGGIIRGGLGYDRSDVAVVTNISADHLGQDGLDSVDDLVFVKSLIVEAVHKKGAVVLNADDPNVLKMLPRARASVILFSLNGDNLVLLRHLSAGGKGITVRGNVLYRVEGTRWQKMLPVKAMPITFNGLAEYNLQNAMAAAAAAMALNLPKSLIIKGLSSFESSPEQNPGRGNLYALNKGHVMLDYGHNPAAMESVAQFASRLNYRRNIAVIGVPGDRNDELIRQCGQACAPYFDQIIIKEDKDLRGRPAGETASLLKEGCLRVLFSKAQVKVILDEVEALSYGMDQLKDGELLIMFYEKLKPLEAVIKKRIREELLPRGVTILQNEEKAGEEDPVFQDEVGSLREEAAIVE